MRRTRKSFLVGSGLVLAATAAGAATPALRSRGWAPLVRLAGGTGDGAEDRARTRVRDGLGTLASVLHGLHADDATRAFFSKIMEQLEGFDLQALYETLPEQDGDYRRVRFTGHSEGQRYEIRTLGEREVLACEPDGPLGSRFGDLAVSFRSKKASGENDNYVGGLQVGLGFGNASWPQVVGAVVEALRLVESTGPKHCDAGVRPGPEALARVKKDNPKCGPEDLEVIAILAESFPKLYEHLTELYRTDDVLVYDPDDSPYQQVHLVMGVRTDSSSAKTAAIREWLTALGPLARGRLEMCDAAGRPLVTIRFSTKDLNVQIDAFLSKGRLCPVEGGQILVDEGCDLETVTSVKRRDRWSLDMDVNGITTEISDLSYSVEYQAGPDGMKARIAFDHEPRVRVRGSAFGIIPTWAIDVVMPSNLEELTTDFLKVMTTGNDGKGIVLDFASRPGKTGTNVLSMDASAEVLNNFLIRLGFKVARQKLVPPEAALDQLAAYFRDGHGAFSADFEQFAQDGK
jgi:hypothetical protein